MLTFYSAPTNPEIYILLLTFNLILLCSAFFPWGPLRWLITAWLRLQSPVADCSQRSWESVNSCAHRFMLWLLRLNYLDLWFSFSCMCISKCVCESVISQNNNNSLFSVETWNTALLYRILQCIALYESHRHYHLYSQAHPESVCNTISMAISYISTACLESKSVYAYEMNKCYSMLIQTEHFSWICYITIMAHD